MGEQWEGDGSGREVLSLTGKSGARATLLPGDPGLGQKESNGVPSPDVNENGQRGVRWQWGRGKDILLKATAHASLKHL